VNCQTNNSISTSASSVSVSNMMTAVAGGQGLASFVSERHAAAVEEVAEFDALMARKIQQLPPSKLKDIALVVGIPFYTEVSNIISVCCPPCSSSSSPTL
jgi:hypothetical protein